MNYSVGGAATPTTDYTALSGTVTFAVDSATADVSVSPVNDTIAKYDETVEVTILDGPDYTIGTPDQATVIIADNEQPVVMIQTIADALEGGDSGWLAISPRRQRQA